MQLRAEGFTDFHHYVEGLKVVCWRKNQHNDPTQLLDLVSEFAQHLVQNDITTKDFLDCFPLPVIISALQTKADVLGLESALICSIRAIVEQVESQNPIFLQYNISA